MHWETRSLIYSKDKFGRSIFFLPYLGMFISYQKYYADPNVFANMIGHFEGLILKKFDAGSQ
jgi:hypothetical protein